MSDMSMEMASEHICCVHCNFCSTILAVSVPWSSMLMMTMVTVRCGHCGNHLSLNMPALHPPHLLQNPTTGSEGSKSKSSSSSSLLSLESAQHPPLGKRKRVPSVYNKFIKEEIQRIKVRSPEISHRDAFSLAAKNWAHFPRNHFGSSVSLEGPTSKASK